MPLLLIIVGMIDLAKAISQQKEDEVKKAQQLLIKKGITAALVFLIVSFVALIFNIVSEEDVETSDTWSCIDALLSGDCTEVDDINGG